MTLFGQLVGAGVAGMIAHAFGWRNVLWFSTAIVFAVAIATAALLSHADTRPRQPAGASAALKNYRALLGNPLSCVFFGVVFVEGACIYGSLLFIGQYLQALGKGGVRETGIVISGIAIGGLAFALALPMLVRFLRRCHMIALGGVVGGAGLACIALGTNWPIETLFMAVVGFGFFLLHNPVQTEVSELAPSARASAYSLLAFTFYLGQAAGPVLYGFGLHAISLSRTFVVTGICLAITGTTAYQLLRARSWMA